ncbi:hypothetical protein E3Q23_02977 [Wallemia mellicola]|uniref:lytic cellulose monooxygenase (C4-dehydrogenating) n=1 Tax=Wallemia mellicola TaxID=1708541 RepID=A0A4T0QC85_9BASI|nr:hypothetical protein E3Q23_02977 [Wallemia mellicola]TIB75308.1 hypothetical protein E3Q24_00007 [Wallemia mellicola]TIB82973.1 hypothetical protein E3Q21_03165 [Wallemia mellicola]TIB85601.1 hypothetical protein E3Q20_03157 [Wallemia mellicola]TIB87354.1 hypothetical protein E3Q19_03634 [Wallemia mellicola]
MFKVLAASTLISSALAHGVISYIDVAQGFTGPQPQESADSPIWTAGIDPVTDAYSPDMFCGPDSHTNNQMASIGAGSAMTIYWEETQGTNWPHNTGPIITYLAACNGDCANMDAGSAQWFKIDQQAFSNGQWVQATLLNGAGYQVTIPSDLAAGNYLMRTEIIALHNSYPEFYPRCSSWTITGGGSNSYSSEATGSFPGSYSPSDAGLSQSGSGIYNVQSTSDYSFPGPELITVGQGGSDSNNSAQPANNVNAQVSDQADSDEGSSNDNDNTDDNDNNDDSDNGDSYAYSSQEEDTQSSSSTEDATAAAQPTESANDQEQETTSEAPAPTSTSESSSVSPAPTSTSSTESAPTTSCSSTQYANEDECESKWTECNNNYVPGEEYTCQTEFSQCRGQSVQRRLLSNQKMMIKRVKRSEHLKRHFRH